MTDREGEHVRRPRLLVLAIAAFGGVLLAPAPAAAHVMHADVTVGATVKLIAYFEEDVPAEFADVVVSDSNGAVVLAGKTDARGVWTFPRPKPGTYQLFVKSFGHTAKVKFEVAAGPGAAGGSEPATDTDPRPGTAGGPADDPEPVTYTDRRASKPLGLALGAGGLLGASALFWLVRRRR